MATLTSTAAVADSYNNQTLDLLKRVALRYLPLLFLLYVVAIIDRVNVGFAKLRMQEALQFSDTVYGIGAGIFFLGYFLFEVPSNMLLARVGARRWIARILILWGPISAATAFVENATQFYILRFLLGVGEAGLFPGIVLYLTYWFPAQRRTRYIAMFMLGMPIAGVIIGPLSAAIMTSMQGLAGLQGWQWMFIVQGLPALFLGFVVLAWLDDGPHAAKWLTPAEKQTLALAVGEPTGTHLSVKEELRLAFSQKGIWLPTASYFFLVSAASSFGLWGPQFLQDILKTNLQGIGAALGSIFLVGTIAMITVGAKADREGPRERTLVAMMALSALGFGLSAAMASNPLLATVAMGLGVLGYLASFPVFWGSLTPRLSVAASAAAIALVNSLGNLGGAVGPAVIGPIKQHQGLQPAMWCLAVMMGLAAVFAMSLRKR
jgi:MFS family permease